MEIALVEKNVSLKIVPKPKTNQKSSKNMQFICVRTVCVCAFVLFAHSVLCSAGGLPDFGEKQNRSLIPMKNLQTLEAFRLAFGLLLSTAMLTRMNENDFDA